MLEERLGVIKSTLLSNISGIGEWWLEIPSRISELDAAAT